MADKMIRCEQLDTEKSIHSLYEWYFRCPPQGKLKHWKDGRSAKETAKHWLHTIPQPFKDLLKESKLQYKLCAPEYVSKFDAYGGNGRNHDLLLLAQNASRENVVISIESKVDESFGDTVLKVKTAAEKTSKENVKSNAIHRIRELRIALFGKEDDNQLHLRYQLLTAVAGTIAEAKAQKANTAYLLIQTFIADAEDNSKYSVNQTDMNNFIAIFSNFKYKKIENDQILGPFKVQNGNKFLSENIDLWMGKYELFI